MIRHNETIRNRRNRYQFHSFIRFLAIVFPRLFPEVRLEIEMLIEGRKQVLGIHNSRDAQKARIQSESCIAYDKGWSELKSASSDFRSSKLYDRIYAQPAKEQTETKVLGSGKKCKICKEALQGRQTKFCGAKCKNAHFNPQRN